MEHRLSVYIDQALTLAQSIVFKHELAAIYVNKELSATGHNISDDQRTWRLYQNLAGQYHPTNTPMQVFSSDTLTTVDYTRETMGTHHATRELLSYDSTVSRSLISRYPAQETLIRSIPHLLNLDDIIAAEDGDILLYDRRLVEPNELTLISDISKWIKWYLHRWVLPSFIDTDEFYYPAVLGVLYSKLPGVILNLRLKRCKTSEVHSFHVKESLRSYRRLDQFYNFLTLDQSLWLYRNLNWLRTHVGQQRSFDMLVNNILTRRGMEIKKIELALDLEDMPHDSLVPKLTIPVTNVNFKDNQVANLTKALDDVAIDQLQLARGNYEFRDSMIEKINKKIPYLTTQYVPTKAYYIEAGQLASENGISIEEMLLEHWISFASRSLYTGFEEFTNPSTGESITINALDGFYLYIYCFYGGLGIDVEKIPEIMANNCRRRTIPSLEQVVKLTNVRNTPQRLPEYTWSAHSRHEVIQPVMNRSQFWSLVNDLFNDFNLTSWPYKTTHDYHRRAELKNVWKSFYFNHKISHYVDQPYEEWLSSKGVNVENFNEIDYKLFAMELLQRFTGIGSGSESGAGALLNAMTMIMQRLTNYSIQFMGSLSSTSQFNLEWSALRCSEIGYKGLQKVVAPVNVRMLRKDIQTKLNSTAAADLRPIWTKSIPHLKISALNSVSIRHVEILSTTNVVQSASIRITGEDKDVTNTNP